MGMVVVIGIGVTLSALVIQGVASGLGVAAEGALVGRRFTRRSLWRNGLATLMLPPGAGPMSPGWPSWNLTQAMTLVVAAVALLVSWPASPAAHSKSAAVGVERLVGRW